MVAAITIARPDRYGSELVYFHSTKLEEPGKTSIAPTVLATAKSSLSLVTDRMLNRLGMAHRLTSG